MRGERVAMDKPTLTVQEIRLLDGIIEEEAFRLEEEQTELEIETRNRDRLRLLDKVGGLMDSEKGGLRACEDAVEQQELLVRNLSERLQRLTEARQRAISEMRT